MQRQATLFLKQQLTVQSDAFTYEHMGPLGRADGCCSPVISQPRSASETGAVLVVTGEFGQQLIATSMRNVDSGITLPKMNGTLFFNFAY